MSYDSFKCFKPRYDAPLTRYWGFHGQSASIETGIFGDTTLDLNIILISTFNCTQWDCWFYLFYLNNCSVIRFFHQSNLFYKCNQRSGIPLTGLACQTLTVYRTPYIIAQYRSMPIKIMELISMSINSNQCRSISLNSSQSRSMLDQAALIRHWCRSLPLNVGSMLLDLTLIDI